METILMSAIVAILSIGAMRIAMRNKQFRIQRYLSQIEMLKDLITMLQAYRDASVNVSRTTLVSIEQSPRFIRDNISRQVELLTDKPMATNERWLGFLDHYKRLEMTPLRHDPGYGFIQYTSLISNLLPLVEELAEEYGFTRQKLELFPNITLMWRELPLLIEYTAQARSLALTVASRPSLTKGDITQLQYINRQVRKLSRVIFHHIRYNGSPTEEREQALRNATKDSLAFSVALEEQLSGSGLTLNDKMLSSAAGASIRGSQKLLDIEYQQISRQLEAG